MKDTKVTWPEAVLVLASSPRAISFDPFTIQATFRSPVDELYSLYVNDVAVSEYILSADRMSVTFQTPGGAPFESFSARGRPRNIDGAAATLKFRGPHAAIGADKLLQSIHRLWLTTKGSVLGRPSVGSKPDLRGVKAVDLPSVIAAAVYDMSQTILYAQRNGKNILASEKLLGIDVLEVSQTTSGGAKARIRVNTAAGSLVSLLSWEGAK
jgi:hypothetical protein